MKHLFPLLTLAALPLAALAQTKPATKPATRPAAKPATRPAATPAPKPGAKPAPLLAARPAAPASPRPAPAAPAPQPARKPAPIEGAFGVGTTVVNVGVGLGNRYSFATALLGGSSSSSPAFSVSVERGILPLGPGYLGVGGFVGYQYSSYSYTFLGIDSGWRDHDMVVMARGAFHYNALPQLDAYGGLGLGVRYSHETYTGTGSTTNTTYLTSGIYLGARYFFAPRLAGFAELGYDQSFFKIGLAAKL